MTSVALSATGLARAARPCLARDHRAVTLRRQKLSRSEQSPLRQHRSADRICLELRVALLRGSPDAGTIPRNAARCALREETGPARTTLHPNAPTRPRSFRRYDVRSRPPRSQTTAG